MIEGIVDSLFISPEAGNKMIRVEKIVAVEGQGIQGDRYQKGSGYWSGIDECPVTFIEAEELEWIAKETGIAVLNGEHRRNIVTKGIFLFEFRDTQFSVGEAVFAYERPRPSCDYIETITEKGMTDALKGERGGICARVLKSGIIRVGDKIMSRDE